MSQQEQDAQAAFGAGDHAGCVRILHHMLTADSNNHFAYNMMGAVCMQTERFANAAKLFQKACDAAPDNARYWANLCAAQRESNNLEDSIESGERSLEHAPDSAELMLNLALSYTMNSGHMEARALMTEALRLEPDNASAHFALGQNLLLCGQWGAGWREYATWNHKRDGAMQFPCLPSIVWNGMTIEDGTLVVVLDEGFGDAIQYARFLSAAKRQSKADRLVVAGPPQLALLGRIHGVDEYTSEVDDFTLRLHTAHCGISMLPNLLEDSNRAAGLRLSGGIWSGYIPPYMHDYADFCQALGSTNGKHVVGLFWRGRPVPRGRSVPFDQLSDALRPLLDTHVFISLQPDATDSEKAMLPEMLCPPLNSFADTSAAIWHCENVLTIDSAVAHLTGAQGCRGIVMLSSFNDWRWGMSSHSGWYPSLELLRQEKAGDWSWVLEAAVRRL